MTDFEDLAEILDQVKATSGRNAKIEIVADFLSKLNKKEVRIATLFLGGKIFPENDSRTLNISWSGIRSALKLVVDFSDSELSSYYKGDTGDAVSLLLKDKEGTKQEVLFPDTLTLERLFKDFEALADISGKGSKKKKQAILAQLLGDATPKEAGYLVSLILGDFRTGFSEGLLSEGIAKAYGVDADLVRRAWSFDGDLGRIAEITAEEGKRGLQNVGVKLFRAVKPMLAASIDDVEEIKEDRAEYAFEYKLDGARVQIHKKDDDVLIFSRRLADVTVSLPDIVALVQNQIETRRLILDGEVVAVDREGRPYPFQVVMKRFGRLRDVDEKSKEVLLALHAFDILLVEEISLVDEPYQVRRSYLEKAVPPQFLAETFLGNEITDIHELFESSRILGHEGLMAKRVDSQYTPGVRGRAWLKVKHTLETMDLAIIAAEWGHGRRSKWLSDYHLAVRDAEKDSFVMIGKTFKGLTDAEFESITQDLLQLEVGRERGLVRVKPEIVVEVLASEIQESPTYDSGMALRFARIVSIRSDKGPMDVLSLAELRKLYEGQFKTKARQNSS